MKRILCAAVLMGALLGCREGGEQELAFLARGERLLTAVCANDSARVHTLLASGAELYLTPRNRALTAAAASGHLAVFKLVFAADSCVDGYWEYDSPLIVASRHNHGDIARFLLENGADVNYADRDGETALMQASSHPDGALARELLARGADPAAQAANGLTALVG